MGVSLTIQGVIWIIGRSWEESISILINLSISPDNPAPFSNVLLLSVGALHFCHSECNRKSKFWNIVFKSRFLFICICIPKVSKITIAPLPIQDLAPKPILQTFLHINLSPIPPSALHMLFPQIKLSCIPKKPFKYTSNASILLIQQIRAFQSTEKVWRLGSSIAGGKNFPRTPTFGDEVPWFVGHSRPGISNYERHWILRMDGCFRLLHVTFLYYSPIWLSFAVFYKYPSYWVVSAWWIIFPFLNILIRFPKLLVAWRKWLSDVSNWARSELWTTE